MKIDLNIEQLKEFSLWVGIPMYGGNCHGLNAKACIGLAQICGQLGIKIHFDHLYNESLVQRARNYITDNFMRSDYTHLMFIDSDIAFNPRNVIDILQLQISDPEKYNIVGVPYTKKTIAWEKVIKAAKEGHADVNPHDLAFYAADFTINFLPDQKEFIINEPTPIAEMATGFMLIPRNALEKYRDAYPEYLYKPDHLRTENYDGSRMITAFFDCGIEPESRRYLSEDYFFCYKSRQLSINIHICPWIELAHIGSYVFRGSLAALASLGVSASADQTSNPKNYKSKKIKNVRH